MVKLKAYIAGVSILLTLLFFQNCGDTREGGSAIITSESDSPENPAPEDSISEELAGNEPLTVEEPLQLTVDNFGLKIASSSHVAGTAADCEVQFSARHPKGRVALALFVDDRELGQTVLNDGNPIDENKASGVLKCSDFGQFNVDPGSESIVSMEIVFNDDLGVVRSNVMKLSIPPLVKAAVSRDYRSFDHTLRIHSDYSHCKYPRQLNRAGAAISKVDFKKIAEYRAGGICNGSYPGTGVEPKDWIYDDPKANPLLKNIPYRYDGINLNYTGTVLCRISDPKLNVPGLINADIRAATDPVRIKLKSLIAGYYVSKPACN